MTALPFLVSCTTEKFERAMRPVGLYIERSSMTTDFDPRVLSSDGEGITLGMRYDLGMLFSEEPLTAGSLLAIIEQMPRPIEQNVTVDQHATNAADAQATSETPPYQGPSVCFLPPATPMDPKEHDDGWPSEAKIAAVAAALATVLAGWHKVRGLPFTKKRRDQKAFRHPAGH